MPGEAHLIVRVILIMAGAEISDKDRECGVHARLRILVFFRQQCCMGFIRPHLL